MGYREVRVYDGDFPTHEQILTHDPARPPFPKEVWLQQVQTSEFAIRYKDFKTGLARNADGRHVQSSEACRIFGDLEEARANSREIVEAHPSVVCVVYDHSGAQIDRISNSKVLNKYAVVVYAGILFWGTIYTVAGMALLWLLYRVPLYAVKLWHPSSAPVRSLSWMGWVAFAAAGLLTAIASWLLHVLFVAKRRVRKVRSSFTPEEMRRFEEVNTLHSVSDPAERERLLTLAREFRQRVGEASRK